MAIIKCIDVRMGVIYDSQATYRKRERLPVRAPLSLAALLLVTWESQLAEIHKKTPTNRGKLLFFV
jgi:hypothetical protein